VTIDENLKFVVSDRVKTDFNNGNEYRRLHGATVAVPVLSGLQPNREALRWHNERVFLGWVRKSQCTTAVAGMPSVARARDRD
jgi:putative restriction endonuclease